jgi:hypothetical protein
MLFNFIYFRLAFRCSEFKRPDTEGGSLPKLFGEASRRNFTFEQNNKKPPFPGSSFAVKLQSIDDRFRRRWCVVLKISHLTSCTWLKSQGRGGNDAEFWRGFAGSRNTIFDYFDFTIRDEPCWKNLQLESGREPSCEAGEEDS